MPFVSKSAGGSQRSAAQVATCFKNDKNINCVGVFPRKASGTSVFKRSNVQYFTYKTNASLEDFKFEKKFFIFLKIILLTWSSFSILFKVRPDLVYVNDSRSLIIWGIAAKILKIPVVWHVRSFSNSKKLNLIRKKLVDYIILLCQSQKKIVKTFSQKKFLLQNFSLNYRIKKFNFKKFNNPCVNAGFIGTFNQRKRPDWILKLANYCNNRKYKIKIKMIGPGANAYKKLVKKRDCNIKNVFFSETKQNLFATYKSLHVLFLPSITEAQPRVVVEAMQMGVPVVATKVGAVSSLVDNNINGLLCPANSFKKFRDYCIKIICNKKLNKRFAYNSFKKMKSNYSQKKIIQCHRTVFYEILKIPL